MNYKNILDGIGNTPLIRLEKTAQDVKSDIFAKLEYFNPMGSIKDRIACYMIEKAEKDGRIKPGDTIIDNSSGNTALGLAMVGAIKRYKVKMVVRDSLSMEKIKFLRAMNVELVMVDHTLPPDSTGSYNNITRKSYKILQADTISTSTITKKTAKHTITPPAPRYGIRWKERSTISLPG